MKDSELNKLTIGTSHTSKAYVFRDSKDGKYVAFINPGSVSTTPNIHVAQFADNFEAAMKLLPKLSKRVGREFHLVEVESTITMTKEIHSENIEEVISKYVIKDKATGKYLESLNNGEDKWTNRLSKAYTVPMKALAKLIASLFALKDIDCEIEKKEEK